MATYTYTAKDEKGNKFTSIYNDIADVRTLRDELGKMGYVVVKARREKDLSKKQKRPKASEVVAFAYKFAGMYSAGLSILRCLEALEEQTENRAFKHIITDIRHSIENGSSLTKAFGKYKDIFSEFFLGMLEAGESGGRLAMALEMSATYLEKQADLKRKVKSALAYPVVVSIVCFLVVCCLLVFIIPVFEKLYAQLHVQLPGPTQALIYLSALVRHWWWAIIIGGVATVIGLRRLRKNPNVRARWDVFKLNMPIFGNLNCKVVISQFTRTFAMLISVGISLVEALDIASEVAHNHRMTGIAEELKASVKAGHPVAKSIKTYDIFPPIITQLAASGEEAGTLPEMLNKGADFLDKDIDKTIHALLIKLEPAMTIIMGVIVGFLLMSVYLPMFDYMASLK